MLVEVMLIAHRMLKAPVTRPSATSKAAVKAERVAALNTGKASQVAEVDVVVAVVIVVVQIVRGR